MKTNTATEILQPKNIGSQVVYDDSIWIVTGVYASHYDIMYSLVSLDDRRVSVEYWRVIVHKTVGWSSKDYEEIKRLSDSFLERLKSGEPYSKDMVDVFKRGIWNRELELLRINKNKVNEETCTELYKCKYCNVSSTATEWNNATKVFYNNDIYEIQSITLNSHYSSLFFVCPSCKKDCYSHKNDIRKVK